MREFVVGTRNSKLALIQTKKVIERLRDAGVTAPIRMEEIVTKGDRRLDVSLPTLGGGVFLQDIESKIANGDIDFAVHSLKDAPAVLPEGLHMASIPEREDIRDAYLANHHVPFMELPEGAVIGTCSVRRAAQLRRMRPDIQTKSVRGPIDSRIAQMQNGDYDAIILAVSGIKRLGAGLDVITEYLSAEQFVPAIGQAALAIESRVDDTEVNELLQNINDPDSETAVQTERLFMNHFSDPDADSIAGYATVQDGQVTLTGMIISLDGTRLIRETASGRDPRAVASEVYHTLSSQGAETIIRETKEELGKE
ncbi:MAG TPA: hydroxymethylbilane synthase [Virgibacillus sp.]|nr:hydroxymethylbilane synthase [Virgibacillus sp.]